ncbi:MAG: 4'-phosphopantetheinyl transferase superfamily protein [Ruminococcaceae bacterium]|nr:4'-phosphopantetheinyl transferase superfamily protein [Oscillospiraceae bacterium]
MIGLFIAKVSDYTDEELKSEYFYQNDIVREHLDKKNQNGIKESLSALCLLRFGIKQAFGDTDYTLSYNQNGKPFMDKCFISLSHSGGYVACALSDKNIGMDIEVLKDIKKCDTYKFFTEKESIYINEDINLLSKRYLEIWTKKEAVLKFYSLRLCDCGKIDTLNLPKNLIVRTKWQDDLVISVCEEV